MFAIVQDDQIIKIIQPHTEFELFGKQYNAKWTVRMTQEEKNQLGIVPVVVESRPNDKFYFITENPVKLIDGVPTITYEAIARAIDDEESTDEFGTTTNIIGLKTSLGKEVKTKAKNMLSDSDWYVTRKSERNVDIPLEISNFRANVLIECDRLLDAYANVSNTTEIIDVYYSQNWPSDFSPVP